MRRSMFAVASACFILGACGQGAPTPDLSNKNEPAAAPKAEAELSNLEVTMASEATGAACSGIPGTNGIDHYEIDCGICEATPEGVTRWAAYQCRNGEAKNIKGSCVSPDKASCGLNTKTGNICVPYPRRDGGWKKFVYEGDRACLQVNPEKDLYLYVECKAGHKLAAIEAKPIDGDDARCNQIKIEPD